MKKITFILTLTICLSLNPFLRSEWMTDFRLTNDPNASVFPFIAVSGSFIHVVWRDSRNGPLAIYYKRSTDNGLSWSTDTKLTNDSAIIGANHYPFMAASGSNVYVVWPDSRIGNSEIYYKRSTNNGLNWTEDTRLTQDPASSEYAYVAATGSNVHVVWRDNRDGNFEIYYKRSLNGGSGWEADTRLTNDPVSSNWPTVAVNGSNIHVLWRDFRDGNWEIYYKRSITNGSTWEADKRLTNDPAASESPFVSVSDVYVHIVWYDSRDGNNEVYYKRSTNNGVNWENDKRLTYDPSDSPNPFITASGSNVHIVWEDFRDGNYEIYYNRSTNYGVSWETDTRLTEFAAYSRIASAAVTGSNLHVVWHDFRDGNWEIYYKRNPNGNITGITNNNLQEPAQFKLKQNYPNPFNPVTKIEFDIPVDSYTELKIYDILGNEINTLINKQLKPGTYEIDWNALDYPGGTYFYKISAVSGTNNYSETKRMVLVK
jgi:hypothetical protein